ncbi:developmental pluripotency-associated protein 3 isoform X2 [Mustela nigripes]|uniref:developmental pluripotency-associated protein 3 isoform X2 n=1 Tax=Mustela nigripes TaxID=77151 RepID=UPI002814F5F7|nr:developmental pluripotency-associated protein 3 isoform X2 [Mustela nigripes]
MGKTCMGKAADSFSTCSRKSALHIGARFQSSEQFLAGYFVARWDLSITSHRTPKIEEEPRSVTRLPMDSPEQLYPTWAPGSSQTPNEEDSQESSEYPSQQPGRERKPQGLVERILSSSGRRTGVRTLLTARKERMARMIRMIQYQRYLNPGSQLQKDLQQKETEEGETRVERFRCRCHYCLYHKDLAEETSMENNYDVEPM